VVREYYPRAHLINRREPLVLKMASQLGPGQQTNEAGPGQSTLGGKRSPATPGPPVALVDRPSIVWVACRLTLGDPYVVAPELDEPRLAGGNDRALVQPERKDTVAKMPMDQIGPIDRATKFAPPDKSCTSGSNRTPPQRNAFVQLQFTWIAERSVVPDQTPRVDAELPKRTHRGRNLRGDVRR